MSNSKEGDILVENKKDHEKKDSENEGENWGDFGKSMKEIPRLVPLAEEVGELQHIKTEEIDGPDNYKRFDGRGPPQRFDGPPRNQDRRSFDRRDESNPPKRRNYDSFGNDRFNDSRSPREFDDRRGGNDRFNDRRNNFNDRPPRENWNRDRFNDRSPRDFNNERGYDRFNDSRSRDAPRNSYGDRPSYDRNDSFRGESRGWDNQRGNDRFQDSRERGSFRGNPPAKSLRIFSCPPDCTEEDFRNWFESNCSSVRCQNYNFIKDRETGSFKGFAFINYNTIEDAQTAKDSLYSVPLLGKRVKVDFALSDRSRGPPRRD